MLVCLCEGGTRGAASPLGRIYRLTLLLAQVQEARCLIETLIWNSALRHVLSDLCKTNYQARTSQVNMMQIASRSGPTYGAAARRLVYLFASELPL